MKSKRFSCYHQHYRIEELIGTWEGEYKGGGSIVQRTLLPNFTSKQIQDVEYQPTKSRVKKLNLLKFLYQYLVLFLCPHNTKQQRSVYFESTSQFSSCYCRGNNHIHQFLKLPCNYVLGKITYKVYIITQGMQYPIAISLSGLQQPQLLLKRFHSIFLY